jgi:hypothetical protein
MANDLTPVQNLNDLLANRVKGFLVDVLPDDVIKQYADKAVAEFVTGYHKVVSEGYGSKSQFVPPKLEELVRSIVFEELERRIRDRMKEQLKPLLDAQYGTQEQIDAAVEQVMVTMGPTLMKSVVAGFAAQVLPSIASSLQWNVR